MDTIQTHSYKEFQKCCIIFNKNNVEQNFMKCSKIIAKTELNINFFSSNQIKVNSNKEKKTIDKCNK